MSLAPGSLRANFSWTLVANILYSACQWGVLATSAKVGTPQMVGEFALALALTIPIQAFFQMQLRGVQATDAKREFDDAEYFTFRSLTTILAIVFSLVVAMAGHFTFDVAIVIIVMSLGKAFDSISDVFYGAFQQRERMEVIAKATMINGVASLSLVMAGVWYTEGLLGGTIGYALGSLVPLVFYVIPRSTLLLDHLHRPIHWWKLPQNRAALLLRVSFPLGITMLLMTVNANVQRYVVEYYLGTDELGIFAALSYLLVAGSTIVSAMGQAVSPRLARNIAEGQNEAFARTLLYLALVGIALGVAGFLLAMSFGGSILTILYTPTYAEYADVLAILTLGGGLGFAASLLGYGLTATRRFELQVPIFLIVIVSNIAVSIWLIPTLGLMGAAVAAGITFAINLIASWFALAKILGKVAPRAN